MSVLFYEKKNFAGDWQFFGKDRADIAGTKVGKNPSSIKVSKNDAVVLFKKKDWKGDALYIRGPAKVKRLGDLDGGGGFTNSVRSVRRTPFTLDLNVNIVKTTAGQLPGAWKTRDQAVSEFYAMLANINSFFANQRALLTFNCSHLDFRPSNKKFDIKGPEGWRYPRDWKSPSAIDVIIVNSFNKEERAGFAKSPMWGNTVIIAGTVKPKNAPRRDVPIWGMAYTLAHEIGHYLGLGPGHGTSRGNTANLMHRRAYIEVSLSDKHLKDYQIQEMHNRLSKNLARKGDRNC